MLVRLRDPIQYRFVAGDWGLRVSSMANLEAVESAGQPSPELDMNILRLARGDIGLTAVETVRKACLCVRTRGEIRSGGTPPRLECLW